MKSTIPGLRGLSKRIAELADHAASVEAQREALRLRDLGRRIMADPEALEAALAFGDWVQAKEWPLINEDQPHRGAPHRDRDARSTEPLPQKIAAWMKEDPSGQPLVERCRAALERAGGCP